MFKRILAILISVLMILSFIPLNGVNAEDITSTDPEKKVHLPVLQPMKATDTEIVGWTTPKATVKLKVDGTNETSAKADKDGKFIVTVPELKTGQIITAVAEKHDDDLEKTFQSKETTHIVSDADDIKGRFKDTYTWYGPYSTNVGLKEDEEGKKYFAMTASVSAITEAYLAYLKATMFYRVDGKAADYIEKVDVRGFSSLIVIPNKWKTAELDTEELPGVKGVYKTRLLSSKGGWLYDTGADRKIGEFRFYLKDNTPDSILKNGITVKTWAREGNKVYNEFLFSQKLIDVDRLAEEENGYSDFNKFLDSPGTNRQPRPVFENLRYNVKEKSIEGKYIISKNGKIVGKYGKSALFIHLDPAIEKEVNKILIEGKEKTFSKVTIKGKQYLVIEKAFDFIGKLVGTYEGDVKIELNKRMIDIITEKENAYDVELSIRDKPTSEGKLLRNTLSINTLYIKDSDQDKIADELETSTALNTILTTTDTDADGKLDAYEVKNETDPIVPPFDWYDKNNKKIILAENTKEITGYVGNYSERYAELGYVQPRRIELWKTDVNGNDITKIADTISNKDRFGTFAFKLPTDEENKLKAGEYLKVKIYSDEITGKLEKDDEEGIIQKGYTNPEESKPLIVIAKTKIEKIDNEEHFGTTYTYISGKTEPNSDVSVSFADGNILKGKADDNGRFKLLLKNAIPLAPVLKADEKIVVIAKAPEKAESDPYEITIVEGSKKPTINAVNDTETTITGTTSPTGKTTAKIKRGDKEYIVPEDAITVKDDGSFEIDVTKITELGQTGLSPKDEIIVTNTEEGKAPTSTSEFVSSGAFDKNNIKSIKVLENPKTDYIEGDKIDLTNLKVELTDTQGRTKIVTLEDNNTKELVDLGIIISPSTTDILATTNDKITLSNSKGNISADIPINVAKKVFNPDAISKIELVTPPKLEYIEDELFDASELVVRLTDTQGLSKEISYEDFVDYDLSLNYIGKDNETHTMTGAIPLKVDDHNGVTVFVQNEFGKKVDVGDVVVTKTNAQEFGDITIPDYGKELGDVVTKNELTKHVTNHIIKETGNTKIKSIDIAPEFKFNYLRLTTEKTRIAPVVITFKDGSIKELTVDIPITKKTLDAPKVELPTKDNKKIIIKGLGDKTPYTKLQENEKDFNPEGAYIITLGEGDNIRQVILSYLDGKWSSDDDNFIPNENKGNLEITLNDASFNEVNTNKIQVQKIDVFGNESKVFEPTVLEKDPENPGTVAEDRVRLTFTTDENGKLISEKFGTADSDGTKVADKVIYDVKKGTNYSEITFPETKANENYAFDKWNPEKPEQGEVAEKSYEAKFKVPEKDADKYTPNIPTEKTPVEDTTQLTEEEKAKVKKAVEDANVGNFPDGTEVTIGDDGTATITYPDGSKDTIPGTDLVKEKDSIIIPEVEPTPVQPYIPYYPSYDNTYVPAKPEKDEVVEEEEKPEDKLEAYYSRRYMQGNSKGLFLPDKPLTRAEAAQIIANVLEFENYRTTMNVNPYKDVKASDWWYDAVMTVTEAGIFEGFNGNFMPEKTLTAPEWISVLVRFKNFGMLNNSEVKGPNWADSEIAIASQNGWLDIYPNGVDYSHEITREEVVYIANRAFNKVPDKYYIDSNISNLHTFKDVTPNLASYYEILAATNSYAFYKHEDVRIEWFDNHLNDMFFQHGAIYDDLMIQKFR